MIEGAVIVQWYTHDDDGQHWSHKGPDGIRSIARGQPTAAGNKNYSNVNQAKC